MPELRLGRRRFAHWSDAALCKFRQRGSHVMLKRRTPEGEVDCVVPLHRELAIGTLRGILKQARLTSEEFMESL